MWPIRWTVDPSGVVLRFYSSEKKMIDVGSVHIVFDRPKIFSGARRAATDA